MELERVACPTYLQLHPIGMVAAAPELRRTAGAEPGAPSNEENPNFLEISETYDGAGQEMVSRKLTWSQFSRNLHVRCGAGMCSVSSPRMLAQK